MLTEAPDPTLVAEPEGAGPTLPPFARMAESIAPRQQAAEREAADFMTQQQAARAREVEAKRAQSEAARRSGQEVLAAGQQVRQTAQANAPEPPVMPPAPEGLRAFLAPSANEAPEQSIAKLLTVFGLFAQGISGAARGDARASLAAFTGAMQGWQEGDRARADREFKVWQATSAAMRDKWTMARQRFDDIMSNAKLGYDQKLQGVKLAMLEYGLDYDAAKLEREGLDAALAVVEKRQATLDTLMRNVGEMEQKWLMAKDRNDLQESIASQARALEERIAKQADETRRYTADQTAAVQREGIAARSAEAEQRRLDREALAAQGARTPPETMKRLEELDVARSYLSKMSALAQSPNVRLDKIAGGIRPWINNVIQTGVVAGFIPVKGLGTLTEDEMKFISLTQDYADTVSRIRSGANIPVGEMTRLLAFLPDQRLTPETLRARIKLADDTTLARIKIIEERARLGGYRAPSVETPAPIGDAPVPSGGALPGFPAGGRPRGQ